MGTNLMVLAIIVLIVLLTLYLFYSSGVFGKIWEMKEECGEKFRKVREGRYVEITQAPLLLFKREGEKDYHETYIKKADYSIGRDNKNDLILDTRTVEKVHAMIQKKQNGDKVYYELINHGKVNPVQYYRSDDRSYVTMAYRGPRSRVVLDPAKRQKEIFYIGNNKLMIVMPFLQPRPSKTELQLNEERKEQAGGRYENRSPLDDSMLDPFGDPEI